MIIIKYWYYSHYECYKYCDHNAVMYIHHHLNAQHRWPGIRRAQCCCQKEASKQQRINKTREKIVMIVELCQQHTAVAYAIPTKPVNVRMVLAASICCGGLVMSGYSNEPSVNVHLDRTFRRMGWRTQGRSAHIPMHPHHKTQETSCCSNEAVVRKLIKRYCHFDYQDM